LRHEYFHKELFSPQGNLLTTISSPWQLAFLRKPFPPQTTKLTLGNRVITSRKNIICDYHMQLDFSHK
jgi:hypothetical protein